jgi:small nuclear ribonucleoprotein (snRNP)-like protein
MIRIGPGSLLQKYESWKGSELNVVMNDDKTYFGQLESANASSLTLKDSRGYRHSLELSGVFEIIYDHENR